MGMTAADVVTINARKLARVHGMASALIDELHRGQLDDQSRARLERLSYDALVEMGSAVPDDMLEELHRLVQPADGPSATDAELRVVWAQLLGWLNGVAVGERVDDLRSEVRHDREAVACSITDAASTALPLGGPYL
jgi:hypothetical protein